jgi:hypothetical protein
MRNDQRWFFRVQERCYLNMEALERASCQHLLSLHATSQAEEKECWLVNEVFLCLLNCASINCIERTYKKIAAE